MSFINEYHSVIVKGLEIVIGGNNQMFGYGYGGFGYGPCCGFGYGGWGAGFALIVVLFILLIIVGASWRFC